jgi:uncharacterized protein
LRNGSGVPALPARLETHNTATEMDTALTKQQLHAGWRLVLYLILVVAIGTGSMVLLDLLFQPSYVVSATRVLVHELWSFAVVLCAALVMAQIEHRSPGAYGLPLHGAFLKRFGQGALLGIAEISVLIGLIAAFGGYSFGSLALHGTEIVRWAGLWLLVFAAVGLFEEFSFRGYTQLTLAEWLGFWPAAIILSGVFAALHRRNAGENWIGVAGVFVIGMIFAFSLKRTGTLWLAIGMHTGFDFGETFLYSAPNSGIQFQGHLSNAQLLSDKVWLTGGTVGPEASVFSFVTMLLVALAIHLYFPAGQPIPDLPAESVDQI